MIHLLYSCRFLSRILHTLALSLGTALLIQNNSPTLDKFHQKMMVSQITMLWSDNIEIWPH